MESKHIQLYQVTPNELTENFSKCVDIKLKEFFDKYPPQKDNEEELLTVEETLKFLKCSKQALWNWRKNGILPSFRLGNRVYYKKSDIYSKLIKQE
jgi:predicted DNA-binding transcriptional regulator AlpA